MRFGTGSGEQTVPHDGVVNVLHVVHGHGVEHIEPIGPLGGGGPLHRHNWSPAGGRLGLVPAPDAGEGLGDDGNRLRVGGEVKVRLLGVRPGILPATDHGAVSVLTKVLHKGGGFGGVNVDGLLLFLLQGRVQLADESVEGIQIVEDDGTKILGGEYWSPLRTEHCACGCGCGLGGCASTARCT